MKKREKGISGSLGGYIPLLRCVCVCWNNCWTHDI